MRSGPAIRAERIPLKSAKAAALATRAALIRDLRWSAPAAPAP
jgi:hypothetical protein